MSKRPPWWQTKISSSFECQKNFLLTTSDKSVLNEMEEKVFNVVVVVVSWPRENDVMDLLNSSVTRR